MKKIRILLLLSLLLVGTMAEAAKVLRLTDGDGKQTLLSLAGKPVLTIGADELTVTDGTTTLSYGRDSHLTFEFIDETTAVERVETSAVRFNVNGQQLSASGLKPGESLNVYTTDGKRVASARANSQGQASVSLSQRGQILVVKAAQRSFKLVK